MRPISFATAGALRFADLQFSLHFPSQWFNRTRLFVRERSWQLLGWSLHLLFVCVALRPFRQRVQLRQPPVRRQQLVCPTIPCYWEGTNSFIYQWHCRTRLPIVPQRRGLGLLEQRLPDDLQHWLRLRLHI